MNARPILASMAEPVWTRSMVIAAKDALLVNMNLKLNSPYFKSSVNLSFVRIKSINKAFKTYMYKVWLKMCIYCMVEAFYRA